MIYIYSCMFINLLLYKLKFNGGVVASDNTCTNGNFMY